MIKRRLLVGAMAGAALLAATVIGTGTALADSPLSGVGSGQGSPVGGAQNPATGMLGAAKLPALGG
ncbi:MAG TPA: hypothetical protein VGH89_40565 [Pseudonocardia sp.]|jgi:hypothetical protein